MQAEARIFRWTDLPHHQPGNAATGRHPPGNPGNGDHARTDIQTVLVARNGSEYPSRKVARHPGPCISGDRRLLVFRMSPRTARSSDLMDRTVLIETVLNTVEEGIITFAQRCIGKRQPAAERMFGYTRELVARTSACSSLNWIGTNRVSWSTTAQRQCPSRGLGHEVVGCRKTAPRFPGDRPERMGLGGSATHRHLPGHHCAETGRGSLLKVEHCKRDLIAQFLEHRHGRRGVIQIFNVGPSACWLLG